ncbi:hypothetical protein PWT90_03714 [Aphanocladium album]|nr:hypothetical protein PWT90_03714 [Aphanocladium album]
MKASSLLNDFCVEFASKRKLEISASEESRKSKMVPKCGMDDHPVQMGLEELFSENTLAKIARTASQELYKNKPPTRYPETVPQSGQEMGNYQFRALNFWTSGFLPGCIYSLLERAIKYPQALKPNSHIAVTELRKHLQQLGLSWSEPLQGQALRTDTHDLGFMIMPHMRPRWELFHDTQALDAIITAAESLYSRFDPGVGAVRSWDDLDWLTDMAVSSKENDFLVIIDSMCNMELLFYASAQSGQSQFANAAVQHSRTLLKSHLRAEQCVRSGYNGILYSTSHLVNFDPHTGTIKETNTAQGYSKTSTWSRGQAWAILGYAQAYQYSKEPEFIDAACGLAEYFMLRLEGFQACVDRETGGTMAQGRYVPLWDFDAPVDSHFPLRDSSAGMVAANGMLILSTTLTGQGKSSLAARYLQAAIAIVKDTISFSLAKEKACVTGIYDGALEIADDIPGRHFDAILKHATVCNNPSSTTKSRSWNQGLVYGDYYFIEFGTRLLGYGLA